MLSALDLGSRSVCQFLVFSNLIMWFSKADASVVSEVAIG